MTKAIYTLVGVKQAGALEFVASLPAGEPLELIREPFNPYDANAVAVRARGLAVGYVGRGRDPSAPKYKPGSDNVPLARFIDKHGKPVVPGDPPRAAGRLVPGNPPQIEVEETP